jgi:hypothetical protein
MTSPQYQRGFTVMVSEPNAQEGLSFSYYQPPRYTSGTPGVAGNGTEIAARASRAGYLAVSNLVPVRIPELDLPRWHATYKSSLADLVDRGILIVYNENTAATLTGDQVRAL